MIIAFFKKVLKYLASFKQNKQENTIETISSNESLQQEPDNHALQVRDIVLAWMSNDEEVLKTIPEGHQVRPYIIIEINSDSVLAFPLTSSKPDKKEHYFECNFTKHKTSYAIFNRSIYYPTLLPYECILQKKSQLSENEYSKFCKALFTYTHGNVPYVYNHLKIDVGDIVTDKELNLYYVYSNESDEYMLLPLHTTFSNNSLQFKFYKNYLYIDGSDSVIVKDISKFHFKYLCDENTRLLIDAFMKRIMIDSHQLSVGDVVIANNTLVIISEILNDTIICNELSIPCNRRKNNRLIIGSKSTYLLTNNKLTYTYSEIESYIEHMDIDFTDYSTKHKAIQVSKPNDIHFVASPCTVFQYEKDGLNYYYLGNINKRFYFISEFAFKYNDEIRNSDIKQTSDIYEFTKLPASLSEEEIYDLFNVLPLERDDIFELAENIDTYLKYNLS